MGIAEKFFKKKEPKQSKLELVEPLFQSYLVSSAANYQTMGNDCLDTRFTSMAIEQPVTFFEYCKDYYEQILFSQAEGMDLVSLISGRNNSETFQLRSAYNILAQNFDNTNFQYLCGCVSAIYESALATSNKAMIKSLSAGKDSSSAELTTSTIENLQANYAQTGLNAFTKDGFARKTLGTYEEPSVFRDTTLSARETATEVLEQPYSQVVVKELQKNPTSEFYNNNEADIIDVSLAVIREGTFKAQNLIANYNSEDFMIPTQPVQG